MPQGDQSKMSDYERKAWDALIAQTDKRSSESRAGRMTGAAKSQVKDVASKARAGITAKVPGADKAIEVVDASIQKAWAGLHTAFVERGLNSVSPTTIFATFASEGVDVTSYDGIRELDLKHCDR